MTRARSPWPAAPIARAVIALAACATQGGAASAQAAMEEIYILRSIREPHAPAADWCAAGRTGFEPFPVDAERVFSFWSVRSSPDDGRVIDAGQVRVAELRGCFGPSSEPARQNFYAEIQLGGRVLRGHGECLALALDTPEPGLYPVRCQLILGGPPGAYAGGLLTTNTMTSNAAFGGETDPAGYTQASIATIRLWRARSGPQPPTPSEEIQHDP